jgi:SAM-dependent methyltransferase
MMKKMVAWLKHPLTRGVDIDSPENTRLRFQIVKEKGFLSRLYDDWYRTIVACLPREPEGRVLELGSGAGHLKKFLPGLITSEILQISGVDIIADGCRLCFKAASLQGIVMVDVFHHLPDVRSFLKEAGRCVKPGGAVVMIEPWVSPWSRMIYGHLHHEPIQPQAPRWELTNGGPLSQSNSALPWIVFNRDRSVFEREFPIWRLKSLKLHTPWCYLLSGGVAFRLSVPANFFTLCRRVEHALDPWMNYWAMFATIAIERRS